MINSGAQLRKKRERMKLSQAKLAEATGVSQHLLSAYELGKAEIAPSQVEKIISILKDSAATEQIVKRKKRYREHTYEQSPHLPDRVARHARTEGNIEYTHLINADKRNEAKRRKAKAISLFSGCGGFSLGFEWAGYEIKGFLEIDRSLQGIYVQNFPDAVKIGEDISNISDAEIKAAQKKIGEIDIIIGGPPCQGFSLSGKRDVTDPRNSLFKHYLRFVKAFRPKVAVLENVRLLTSMKSPNGTFVKDEIRQDFQEHGYTVEYFEVNAKDYGVPQHRERVFFVAVRNDLQKPPSFPRATHGLASSPLDQIKPYRNFSDACSDLSYIESGESSNDHWHSAVQHPRHVIDWLWDVKEGASAHDNQDPEKRPPSGYNTTYKRQIWGEPASTVQTTFGMISGCRNVHPIATRSLTIREAARIQSFPDTFKFVDTLGTIRTGIGNAVPPLLAHVIATHIGAEFIDFIEVASL